MNTGVVIRRYLQVFKAHVPLIKFRKGTQERVAASGTSKANNMVEGAAKMQSSSQSEALEDYQLPLRFRRVPMDEKELEAINSGGSI